MKISERAQNMPSSPIEKFCEWCLTDFQYEGQTIMMAPANGFYANPGVGIDEVRLAYVLNIADLEKAILVLRKALEEYPGRKF